MEMATDYGKRLKQARTHAKLTQVQLSEKTGIPQSTISSAERLGMGSSDTPIYANACGVDVMWLTSGTGQMTPTDSIPVTELSFEARYLATLFDDQSSHKWDAKTRERVYHACTQTMLRPPPAPVEHEPLPTYKPVQSVTRQKRHA